MVALKTAPPEKGPATSAEKAAEREKPAERKRLAQEEEERRRQAAKQARLEKLEREKAERERTAEQARLAQLEKERERQAARQARLEKLEREKAERERTAEQARLAREQEEQKRQAALDQARLDQMARKKAERVRVAEQARLAQVQREADRRAGLEKGERERVLAREQEREQKAMANAEIPVAAEKPRQTRGIVIASLRGDLKLVIKGDTSIRLSVRFRDYPKSRRNRVLTKSEAKRERSIVPLQTTTGEETREAVIETAQEGIYVFSAEHGGDKGAKAAFTLRVFESGTREKTAPLGVRTITGKTVLVKILMPEAILWDDDAAFTGSLEDSDGITKFNAATGLYWKEFTN